jgi:hypothetical protein
MRFVTGGLCLLSLLLLLYLLFRIWLEGRREMNSPREIPGEALPDELRVNALRPLRRLSAYYQKRDPAQADACINEVMLPEQVLILGTNPGEIFHGRECAKGLLRGDWKYWGRLALDVDTTSLCRTGNTLYFATRGQIRLDRICCRVPVRITGVLEERDGLWYISKIQFIHNLNFGYAIAAWVPGLALSVCLILFGLSWLVF